jgi:hypothetical protein
MEVLHEAGFRSDEIARLASDEVVGGAGLPPTARAAGA